MRILISLIAIISLASCSEYSRVLKKGTADEKFAAAKKYYNKGDFARAEPLFTDLMTLYFGKSEREEIFYYLAYTHYGMGNYLTAGYYFDNFGKTYPYSERKEETMYMSAICTYHQSLDYELDQESTEEAIRKMQSFINKYPNSGYVEDCNTRMDELRAKLLEKAYYGAKLYYQVEEYRAAIVACTNALNDYPDMIHRDELHFLVVDAAYIYASNSVEQVQAERYEKVVEYSKAYFREFDKENSYHSKISKRKTQAEEALKQIQLAADQSNKS